MRHHICLVLVCVPLLVLAACGSTSTANSLPTATPTPTTPTVQKTPATGMTVYTSPDHKYHISYPTGWLVQTADGNPGKAGFTGPENQYFEVSDDVGTPGGDLTQFITDYCQAAQPGQASGQVTGTPVVLDGQTWLKAECGADAQPSNILIVEVVTYQGAIYQIDYSSPAASFQSDDTSYYAPMEQGFQFLT